MGDAALVERALADPSVGFAEIYDTYGDRLFDYCYGILRSTADAGDALQDTFLAALDKLPQLRDPEKLRPWLYAIARSQCFRRTRSRQRERVSDTVGDTVIGDDDVDSSIETDHLPALVWDAVAGLSEVDRAVIDLNVRHELEGEELASSLGVPSSKAYVMLHRAKARLETSIGALLVTRAGTDECGELAGIVAGQDFTPLIRKRVARHVQGCAICEETQERNRPELLLALVPLLGAPEALREQILTAIGAAAPPGAGSGGGGGGADTPSGDFRWRSRRASSPRQAAEKLEWDPSGFPNPIAVTRAAGWIPAAVGGAIAASILVIAGIVLVNRTDDSVVEVAGAVDATTTEFSTTEPPASVLGTTELPSTTSTAAAAGSTTSDAPTSTALTPAPTSQPEEAPPTTRSEATTEPPTATEPPTTATTEAVTRTTTAPTTTATTSLTSTSTSTTTEAPDTTAPVVSAVSADCGAGVLLSLTITEDRGLGSVDIRASWPDDASTFVDAGGGNYTARIRATQMPPDTFTITVTGTATDLAGNVTDVADSATCTPPDTMPPQVSRLRVVCGEAVQLSVDIVDDRSEKLTVDIVASWDGGAATFGRLGGATYGVEVARDLLPDGLVMFAVSGTAADLAGNTTDVSRSGSCTNIN